MPTSQSSTASDDAAPSAARAGLEKVVIPIVSGSVAGAIEICITYPLEFSKNSMQVQPGRFSSLFHAIRYNVSKDGLSVLYRGLPSWSVKRRMHCLSCDTLVHRTYVAELINRHC